MSLTKVDLAWMAGFVDGEGCISIAKDKSEGGRIFSVVARVSNNNLEALQFIHQWFGGYIRAESNGNGLPPTFSLALKSRKGARFLRAIQPYLHVKSEHARIALELQDRIENTPPNYISHYGRKPFGRLPEEEMQERRVLCDQMTALNQRNGKGKRALIATISEAK